MTILDQIVRKKQKEVRAARMVTSYTQLEERELFLREPLSFRDYILDPERTGIIAEFKRKSPSKGVINGEVKVRDVVHAYEKAGASAISVLTDRHFFGGSKTDLLRAAGFCYVPLLRKDFMIDGYQIVEAKTLGADVILLIAAILTPAQIKDFAALAKSIGLSVLLEVHNLEELERSLDDNVDAVGVNNRNLADFSVSVENSFRLVEHIPDQFLKISESAISDPKIIKDLKQAGFNGFLIGENFMRQPEPGKAMEDFVKEL
jgi:indole-3-glycerol phosphate synthase